LRPLGVSTKTEYVCLTKGTRTYSLCAAECAAKGLDPILSLRCQMHGKKQKANRRGVRVRVHVDVDRLGVFLLVKKEFLDEPVNDDDMLVDKGRDLRRGLCWDPIFANRYEHSHTIVVVNLTAFRQSSAQCRAAALY
jgi:hypothetical protein